MSEAKNRLVAFLAGQSAPLDIYQPGKVRAGVKADVDALIADYERMRGALERQADNMAFVLNRVDLPESWFAKFDGELTEDRQALTQALTQGESA